MVPVFLLGMFLVWLVEIFYFYINAEEFPAQNENNFQNQCVSFLIGLIYQSSFQLVSLWKKKSSWKIIMKPNKADCKLGQ